MSGSSIRNPQSAIRNGLSRRDALKLSASGVVGFSMSGWLQALADDTAGNPKRRRSCILLWMNGGPSTIDLFDLKVGHKNGGPFKAINTNAPGVQISEHLPRLARHMDQLAIVRSLTSREQDHGQATFYLHTGYLPRGAINYPTLGSMVVKEIGSDEAALPNFVSVAPYRLFNAAAYTSGFLGPKYAPLIVGDMNFQFNGRQNPTDYENALKVENLAPPSDVANRFDSRVDILADLQKDFAAQRPGVASKSHLTAYERAVKLMKTSAAKAFNLDEEPANVRDAYGRNLFGQGCLLARRLVEAGVPFVEVTLGGQGNNQLGWDTHANNFNAVRSLSETLDPAWSQLMEDLKVRGLIDSTLIVWTGEFGRTPVINQQTGRDHYPNAWASVVGGGGIKGGQVIGKTSDDAMTVADRPVSVPDFLATVVQALGIDPTTQNMSNVGRPIRIADPKARVVEELLS
jgi:hypothetical protein